MTTKFKVGQKIIRKSDGEIDLVRAIPGMKEYDSKNFYQAEKGFLTENHSWEFQSDWQLVEEESLIPDCMKGEPCGRRCLGELAGYEVYQTPYRLQDYVNNKTIMSKITTFAKNLVLSADEKLLRKYGLHDECGNHTDEAEQLVITKLVKENESYLVELAKAMEADEAKK